jgi:hypothetical protein
MNSYSCQLFTSKLSILSKENISKTKENIEGAIKWASHETFKYSPFNKDNSLTSPEAVDDAIWRVAVRECIDIDIVSDFVHYRKDGGVDFTGLLKGYFMNLLYPQLKITCGLDSFIIDFGGDILGHNALEMTIVNGEINNSNWSETVSGNFVCFTSGNTERRGNHIQGDGVVKVATVIIDDCLPITADIIATKSVAEQDYKPFHPGARGRLWSSTDEVFNMENKHEQK